MVTTRSPFVFFHPRAPRNELPEDDPSRHAEVGQTFLVGADEMAPVLHEVHERVADVPAGFTPLSLGVMQSMVHTLQAKRTLLAPGDDPVPLCFFANGSFLCSEAALDTIGLAQGQVVDRARLITILLTALPWPISGGQYQGRPSIDDVHRLALEDARELAHWFADPAGSCWRAGQPWPEPAPEDGAGEPVSPRVARTINRILRRALDELPAAVLEAAPLMAFSREGVYGGVGFVPWPNDHYAVRRIGPDTDPEDIDAWVESLRFLPDGRIANS